VAATGNVLDFVRHITRLGRCDAALDSGPSNVPVTVVQNTALHRVSEVASFNVYDVEQRFRTNTGNRAAVTRPSGSGETL